MKGTNMHASKTPLLLAAIARPWISLLVLLLLVTTAGSAAAVVTPIGIDATTGRYFVQNTAVIPLMGVSADAACNLHLGTGSDICTFDSTKTSYYVNVLNDLSNRNVNKIRLWVSLNGGDWQPNSCTTGRAPHLDDQPFVYNPTPVGANGIGTWRLDLRNANFFANLASVVAFAQSRPNKIYVEVTFFAPWVGVFELGPWHPNHGRALIGGVVTPVGFSDRAYFVKPDTNPATMAQNEGMRTYQKKVIDWTVDALASYDNVYFEIANEPEKFQPETPGCGAPTTQTATAANVATWQNSMVTELVNYEQTNYVNTGVLSRRHLIAVQPFSIAGANQAFANPNIDIVNGHYTTISAANGGMGAITLARTYPTQPRILGSNEDKISGVGSSGNTASCNATSCSGQPDSARAGAWEFMLTRGGTFDHFGYFYNSTSGVQIRNQIGVLKTFLLSLPLRQVVASPDTPNWINIGSYATTTASNKYYAALEPASTAATIKYALYIHRSTTRNLGFRGYQPVAPPPGDYSENLKLCLGPTSGSYLAEWISPTSGAVLSFQNITWPGSTTCANGGPGSVNLNSQTYTYDIALRVTKQ
ncbi:MAG TPA: hypothetical protein VKK31_13505 [Thermoanaerobaculia bacterium]|nr:hypothetical protein [Thermoanaerobaculia bacterium]